jgi:hypothetical protein
MDKARSPLSLSTQQGDITGFPQQANAVVVVVKVVVVDIEAGRGEAPNDDEGKLYQRPSIAPELETVIYCPHPLYFIRRQEQFMLLLSRHQYEVLS